LGGLTTKPLRILVAGGRGFLGGRIAAHLAEAGHHIILGSRTQAAAPPWLPQAEPVVMQWDNSDALRESCKQVDIVIHAAGMNAKECAEDPVRAVMVNGVNTAGLVDAASAAGVKQFIYLSTAHVYCNPLVGNITEDTPVKNSHPYATSHLAGEQAVLMADARDELHGVVMRLSNGFGAPMAPEANCWMLLINDACRQVIAQGSIKINSNGVSLRDFVPIAVVCETVQWFSECARIASNRGVFNVGSGVAQSVLDVIGLVQKRSEVILGFQPKIFKAIGDSDFQPAPLRYQIERLPPFGTGVNVLKVAEIDRLLLFCQSMFTQTKIRN
jgi:UDP-glucose 4-epimerase